MIDHSELEKMHDLFIMRPDGYVNATVLCRAFGKQWRDYVKFDHASYTFHEYLAELQADLGVTDAEGLVQADEDYVWVDQHIAVSLAGWLSTKCQVALIYKFAELKWGGLPSQAELNELVSPRGLN